MFQNKALQICVFTKHCRQIYVPCFGKYLWLLPVYNAPKQIFANIDYKLCSQDSAGTYIYIYIYVHCGIIAFHPGLTLNFQKWINMKRLNLQWKVTAEGVKVIFTFGKLANFHVHVYILFNGFY